MFPTGPSSPPRRARPRRLATLTAACAAVLLGAPAADAQTITATTLSSSTDLRGIVAGADGARWTADFARSALVRIAPGGATSDVQLNQFAFPDAITSGPDGALWFGGRGDHTIGRVSVNGRVRSFPLPDAGSDPRAIVTGSDGALWFTDSSRGRIGRITTAGVITEFPLPTPGSDPLDIAAGSDGALWFTQPQSNRIGRITTSGTITEFPTTDKPHAITAGPDGALWFTRDAGSSIGRITTAGAITSFTDSSGTDVRGSDDITTGPDGALWFTEGPVNKIGRLTTGGSFSSLATPDARRPFGITLGHDGALYASGAAGGLYRITTSATPATQPAVGAVMDVASVTANTARGSVSGVTATVSGTAIDAPGQGSVIDGTSSLFTAPVFGAPGRGRHDRLGLHGRAQAVYTVTFGAALKDPVLRLSSLASTLTVTVPGGATLTKLAGDAAFAVAGQTVTGAQLGTSDAAGDVSGTVRITGTVNSVTFTATPAADAGTDDPFALSVGVAQDAIAAPALVRLPFDYAADGVTPDESGNGIDGTALPGTAEFTLTPGGRFGRALALDGSDQPGLRAGSAQLGSNTSQVLGSAFSLVTWVRAAGSAADPTVPAAGSVLVGWGGATCADAGTGLVVGANGSVELVVTANTGIATVVRTPPIGVSAVWDGRWHAVTAVYDKTTGTIALWVDGAVVATQQDNALKQGATFGTSGFFGVGRSAETGCPARGLEGELDELRIFSQALTAGQIAYLHRPDLSDPPFLDADRAPVNTGRPVLSGSPGIGATLTCTEGTWQGAQGAVTYATRWERAPRTTTALDDPAWGPIDGASGSSYVPTGADAASRVRCRVSRSDVGGTGQAVSGSLRVDAGVPANTGLPSVVGVPSFRLPAPAGELPPLNVAGLTCRPGSWDNNPDLTYQWLRDGVPIAGATAATYRPRRSRGFLDVGPPDPDGDGGHRLSCVVSGANDVGPATSSAASGPVLAVDGVPLNQEPPSILDGSVGRTDPNPVGRVQVCFQGTWIDSYSAAQIEGYAFRYQWEREGSPIAGATEKTYTTTVDDLGRRISCRVTDTNPIGESFPAVSSSLLIPLPPVAENVDAVTISRRGGRNEADPTNLIALTTSYSAAVGTVVTDRLAAAVRKQTDVCRARGVSPATAPAESELVLRVSNDERCRVLLYAADKVAVTLEGVRYRGARCATVEREVTRTAELCPDLGFKVPAIDPRQPPESDPELLERIATVTPQKVLWDLDRDGVTDAVCPGSAPVLRTILGAGQWNPRAVVVNLGSAEDGRFPSGESSFPSPAGKTYKAKRGALRDAQVKVCATAFDPPPDPQNVPCVTDGFIGRVQVSGNLCPISERDVDKKDYEQFDGSVRELLLKRSEFKLNGEGTATNRAARDELTTIWVSGDRSRAGLRQLSSDQDVREESVIAASLENTMASITTIAEASLPAADLKGLLDDKGRFVEKNGPFALDQIYVSDEKGLAANGLAIEPLANTAALLVPTDVQSAVKDVKSMTVAARRASRHLGKLGEVGVPLADGGPFKAELDDAKSQVTAVLDDNLNLDDLVDDFETQRRAVEGELAAARREVLSAVGEQAKALKRQALAEVEKRTKAITDKLKALDLGPFKLTGDAKVTANNDGTASIKAYAELPGLSIGPAKAKLRADITLKGDTQGRLKLQGFRFKAPSAYLGGIKLGDLDLTFDNGLDIRGKIILPAPLSAGIAINQLKLGPKGQFEVLDVDYVAGKGGGIAVGTGTYLTRFGGRFDLAADDLEARARLSVGPAIDDDGCGVVDAEGKLRVHFASPFSVDAQTNLRVVCIELVKVTFHADDSGLVALRADSDVKFGPLFFKGHIEGKVRLPHWQVGFAGEGGIEVPLLGKVSEGMKVTLSDRGLAACAFIEILGAEIGGGAAIRFVNGRPPLTPDEIISNLRFFTGCDISAYDSVRLRAAPRAAGPGSQTFDIPPGTGATVLSFGGAGAAPRIRLQAPDGRVADFTDADGKDGRRVDGFGAASIIEQEDRTFVILPRPAAGAWTAIAADGSTPIVEVRRAQVLPKPKVIARVTGKGARRVLHYDVTALGGQRVEFFEDARDGHQSLRTVKGGGRGRVPFTVTEAAAPNRTILAQVTQDELPRTTLTVARFRAANPALGRARRVRIRRVGTSAVVSWAPGLRARGYEVQLTTSSGARTLLTPRPGRRTVTLRAVRRADLVRASVVAFSAGGRRSAPAVAVLRPAAKKKPVKRPARRVPR